MGCRIIREFCLLDAQSYESFVYGCTIMSFVYGLHSHGRVLVWAVQLYDCFVYRQYNHCSVLFMGCTIMVVLLIECTVI